MFENVPICGECWINDALTKPERCLFDGDVPVGVLLPVRLMNAPMCMCDLCGGATTFGAHVRMATDDPARWVNKMKALTQKIQDDIAKRGSVEEQRRYSDSERPGIPQLGPMTCTFQSGGLDPNDLTCVHCGNGPDAPIHQKA